MSEAQTELTKAIAPLTHGIVDDMMALVVVDAETADTASVLLTDVRARQKRVEELITPHVQAAHKTWRGLCDLRTRAIAPLAEAETIIKDKLGDYHAEQEAVRRAAEATAERERQQREDDARLAMAMRAEQRGDHEQAEALLSETSMPPVVVTVAPTPGPTRVDGVAFVRRYKAEVVDLRALARAVADGVVAPDVIEPNQARLNKMAQGMGAVFAVPGCRLVELTDVRASGRRYASE